MNTTQEKAVEFVKGNILQKLYSSTSDAYEIKKFEVTEHNHKTFRGKEKTLVFIIVETGLKGDEKTMASIFAREYRHLLIKERGGVELLNAKKSSQKHGWFNAYYALTR